MQGEREGGREGVPDRRMKAGRMSRAVLRLPVRSEMAPMMGGEMTSPKEGGREGGREGGKSG